MIGPPPDTEDIKILKEWCNELYRWLIHPDKLTAQFIEIKEMTADPAAPGTNRVRVYAKDNGAGKTVLSARFATGAVQTVATEP